MTAPLLTPLESAIFDEDVIAEMEEHLDEALACEWCESAPTWSLTMRCCSLNSLVCGECRERIRLSVLLVPLIKCAACRNVFPPFSSFSDAVREVPL